jgi:glycosyltransferase involved in cell wall biosynthesis
MTTLSIIIPVYNQAGYLPECMDSVLNQTFGDFEIIAVNDGSTDDSLVILEQYSVKDSRVRVISIPNGGYGTAMNAGLRHAQGKYIGIVESDDSIAPQMYQKLVATAEQTGADIVKCSFFRVFGGGKKIEEKGWYQSAGESFTLTEHPELCRLHPAIWAAVYKRDFLESNAIRFFETPGASYQDVPFFADTFAAAQSIFIVPKPMYYYRLENANRFSSSNAIDEKVFYRFENHRIAKEIYQKRGLWDTVKYAEMQREFITLNNFLLRIKPKLRRKLFDDVCTYFKDISTEDAPDFLPPNFRKSFRLIKDGRYSVWLLKYALLYITLIRIVKWFGLTDLTRQFYLKRKDVQAHDKN